MAQDRFTIAFSKTKEEQELYEWIKEKAVILGPSVFAKQKLYEAMLEDKKEINKNK